MITDLKWSSFTKDYFADKGNTIVANGNREYRTWSSSAKHYFANKGNKNNIAVKVNEENINSRIM